MYHTSVPGQTGVPPSRMFISTILPMHSKQKRCEDGQSTVNISVTGRSSKQSEHSYQYMIALDFIPCCCVQPKFGLTFSGIDVRRSAASFAFHSLTLIPFIVRIHTAIRSRQHCNRREKEKAVVVRMRTVSSPSVAYRRESFDNTIRIRALMMSHYQQHSIKSIHSR